MPSRLGGGSRQHDGSADAGTAADPRRVVAWDLGRFADANQLLDAADRALAGVAVCAENVDVEEVRVRFAARSHDLAGLDESIARLAALGGDRLQPVRAAMVYAQVQRAMHTGRYLDGLRVADELTHSPATRNRCSSARPAAPVVGIYCAGET